jgi:tripartite-type tricarboxylate transporter receptor subunit TctC
VFGVFALLLSAAGVYAQEFPARSIRLIVPVASGDPLDVQARRLTTKLTESFGQSVVVDNRPGGNYIIGINPER